MKIASKHHKNAMGYLGKVYDYLDKAFVEIQKIEEAIENPPPKKRRRRKTSKKT